LSGCDGLSCEIGLACRLSTRLSGDDPTRPGARSTAPEWGDWVFACLLRDSCVVNGGSSAASNSRGGFAPEIAHRQPWGRLRPIPTGSAGRGVVTAPVQAERRPVLADRTRGAG